MSVSQNDPPMDRFGEETVKLTAVAVKLHTGKVVAQQLGVRIVAVVVGAPPSLLPRRPPHERTASLALAVLLILLVKLLVNLLLQVGEPRVDLGLRLDKSLAQALFDDGQIVVDETVLAVVWVVLGPQTRLLPAARHLAMTTTAGMRPVRGPCLVRTDVLVVLCQLAGI